MKYYLPLSAIFTVASLLTVTYCYANDNVEYITIDNLNCKEDLRDYPDKRDHRFVMHFANCWNTVNEELMQIKESCGKKPAITGFTQDPDAVAWALCESNSKRVKKHNQLVREIKSLEHIKSSIRREIEELDLYLEDPAYLTK